MNDHLESFFNLNGSGAIAAPARAKIRNARARQTFSEEALLKRGEAIKAAWKAGKYSAHNPRRKRGA